MMLRKRSKPAQEEQKVMTESASEPSLPSDSNGKPGRGNSLFSLPGLLVGLAKGVSDSDPARSPTSPLDYRVFSSFGSFLARSPRSPGFDRPRKGWNCDRVALGLVDALGDEAKQAEPCGCRVLCSPGGKSILFGSQMRTNTPSSKVGFDRLLAELGSATSPRSLPKNYVISSQPRVGSPLQMEAELPRARMEPGKPAKIQSCSADMGRLFMARQDLSSEALHSETKAVKLVSPVVVGGANDGSSSGSLPITDHGFIGCLSATDIAQSEDYTCIISRGPNPRTTHIFGDYILESYTSDTSDPITNKQGEDGRGGPSTWTVMCSEDPMVFPSEDFLRICYSCKKKLEGNDIYMYRGEKAFCSGSCRSQEILVEEETEVPATGSSASPRSSSCEEIFLPGMDAAA